MSKLKKERKLEVSVSEVNLQVRRALKTSLGWSTYTVDYKVHLEPDDDRETTIKFCHDEIARLIGFMAVKDHSPKEV